MFKFFYEVLAELRLVKWPSKADLVSNTAEVIFVVVISSIILSIIDICFANLMQLVIG